MPIIAVSSQTFVLSPPHPIVFCSLSLTENQNHYNKTIIIVRRNKGECVQLGKDRDGCPKIVNLGSTKTDLFYERKKYGFKKR